MTYDTGRWGVPDGQIAFAYGFAFSTWQRYLANQTSLQDLSWYQTLFNKKVEIKVGYIDGGEEWLNTVVGGNIASPFGSSSAIQYEMGLTQNPYTQPAAKVIWHITDSIYNQSGAMKSLVENGPAGDDFYDTNHFNPTGWAFWKQPNSGVLLLDEVGYKVDASPAHPQTWVRGMVEYNDSQFANFANPGHTTQGVTAFFALADQQILQLDPSSPFTAYRGLYLGGSYMEGPAQNLPYAQYFEARLYTIGLFDTRPKDLSGVVYSHQVFSKYAADLGNAGANAGYKPPQYFESVFSQYGSNNITGYYTYNIRPGVYLTGGLSYTDNPSFNYTKNEGHSFAVIYSLFTAF